MSCMTIEKRLNYLLKLLILFLSFLEYAAEDICAFLRSRNVSEVLFVPYALNNQVFKTNLKLML